MAKPLANASLRHRLCHSPIRFSELANTPANAFASANGKWQRLFAIRFSEWQSRCIGLWPMQVADPTTLSSEALEQLVKRHFYEQQKTRWWFKNRFRSVGSCVASTIFFNQASIYTDNFK